MLLARGVLDAAYLVVLGSLILYIQRNEAQRRAPVTPSDVSLAAPRAPGFLEAAAKPEEGMRARADEDVEWGRAIAILRIVRGWSQGRLGDAVGIAHSTVSAFEQGARSAPLPVLRQMAAAMGFPAHLLDRARALVRWARAAQQLTRVPAAEAPAASLEVTAAAAGLAREEQVRRALAAMLGIAPDGVEPDAAAFGGIAPGTGAAAAAGEEAAAFAPGVAAAAGEAPAAAASSAAIAGGPASPAAAGVPAARAEGGRAEGGDADGAGQAGIECEAATAQPSRSSEPLPQALRVLRLISGKDRPELAEAIGVSWHSIQHYELGKVTPDPATLQRLLDAMELLSEVYDRTVVFLAEVRAARRWFAREGAASPRLAIENVAAAEAEREESATRGRLGRLQNASRLLEARSRAPQLWRRLQAYPPAVRRALVQESAEFQDAALCELLCEESIRAASDSARRALRLAHLAVLVAGRVPGGEGWRRRVLGYCLAHLANALRVAGRLPVAADVFVTAAELWKAGADEDPGLLNEARVLHLEASLRRDRRELQEALELLDRALAADRWGETASLLIGKSRALEELGDFTGSIAVLQQAEAQIDRDRDLVKLFSIHHNLAFNLCHLGRHGEAEVRLPEVRTLARRLGNQLHMLRVGWLEAKVAAGRGRTAQGVAAFERVRAGFAQRGIAYDAALVTLELAELYALLGRTADVKVLARKSEHVFRQQGVHREARRALDLFRRAADEERATVELIRGVFAYLQRARHDPRLRYREVA
jgi:transcriptional regulator with XRE-family HTH domain